jgi:hypothetical protein
MAYLTCIGVHGATAPNANGFGSRGYWVFRQGRVVVVRYGPVRVRRSRHVAVEWAAAWRERRHLCGSEEAARARLAAILAEKTAPGHGYTRLPRGMRIARPQVARAAAS